MGRNVETTLGTNLGKIWEETGKHIWEETWEGNGQQK